MDLLGRDFGAGAASQEWAGDFEQVPTEEGSVHLAAVVDLYCKIDESRRGSSKLSKRLWLYQSREVPLARPVPLRMAHSHRQTTDPPAPQNSKSLVTPYRARSRYIVRCGGLLRTAQVGEHYRSASGPARHATEAEQAEGDELPKPTLLLTYPRISILTTRARPRNHLLHSTCDSP